MGAKQMFQLTTSKWHLIMVLDIRLARCIWLSIRQLIEIKYNKHCAEWLSVAL